MRRRSAVKSAAERRAFERVEVPSAARVAVSDAKGRRVGWLREISRGGFMIQPERSFKKSRKHKLVIHEPQEDIRIEVSAIVRHGGARHAGFQFEQLSAQAAVDVGNLMGKYYRREIAMP